VHLLDVLFQAAGDGEVDDAAHVHGIQTHAKSNGRHHHLQLCLTELFLNPLSLLHIPNAECRVGSIRSISHEPAVQAVVWLSNLGFETDEKF
jgi:hypothetical protein